jgi:ABC-2 type transport system ATP-binding protein
VLILDEPTVGLDPRQIVEIRSLIRDLAGGTTVLLSTHILPEVSITCRRVLILDHGKLVAEDTAEELVAQDARAR